MRWGVCRRSLACGSERGACLYLARVLLLVCVGVSVHACVRMRARGVRVFGARSLFPTRERESGSVLAGSSVCLLAAFERMEELEDLRESAAEKEKKGE